MTLGLLQTRAGVMLAALVVSGLFWSVAAVPADQGQAQVVVYVEVPASSSADVSLELRSVTLVSGAQRRELTLRADRLVAKDLRGRQFRLAEEMVPPGIYRRVEIDFELSGASDDLQLTAAGHVDSLHVILQRQIPAASSELIALRWTPQTPDPGDDGLGQQIQRLQPDVPPPGSLAFTSNEGSGNLSVIDRNTLRVVDVMWIGGAPRGLAYARLRQWLYVADAETSEIAVFDTRSRHLVRRVSQRFGDEPSRLLLTDDERTLFVLNPGSNVVTVFDAESLHELRRFTVGERPRSFDLDRRTGHLLVTSELTGEIRIYDPALGNEVRTLVTDSSPAELVIDRSGSRIFLSSSARRRLLVLDARSGAQTGQQNLCAPATGLAHNPVSGRLYAALGQCEEIAISLPTRSLDVGTIRLPGRPGLLGFDSDYRQLLVTLPGDDRLAVVNTNSARVIGVVETGAQPYAVVTP